MILYIFFPWNKYEFFSIDHRNLSLTLKFQPLLCRHYYHKNVPKVFFVMRLHAMRSLNDWFTPVSFNVMREAL